MAGRLRPDRARRQGDHWKLNGSKIFITNAGYADVFIIIAVTGFVTDKRGRKQKEISAFIVERTDPGFKVGKPEDKMGIRGSSTCELIMEDCIIPKDRLLGVKGKGFQSASRPRRWAWRKAPSTRPSPTSKSASSSAAPSPRSRTPSSSWPR